MNFSRLRELGGLYPKTAVLGVVTVLMVGGLTLNKFGVTFGLSRFFASDISELSCGEAGGDYCSQEGACPDGASEIGNTLDCSPCCLEGGANPTPEITPDDSGGENNDDQPTPEPTNEVLGGQPGDDPCADGDCDGDGYLNPVVGGNDCDDGNPNVYPGNGCAGVEVATAQSELTPSPTAPPGLNCGEMGGLCCANNSLQAQTCASQGYDNDLGASTDCGQCFNGAGGGTPTPIVIAQASTPPGVDPCADGDCDGDGYLNPVVGGNDCDDGNPNVYPGNGCAVAQSTSTPDATSTPQASTPPLVDPCADGDCDGDGYLNPVVGGNDCDDGDASIYPGAGCGAVAIATAQATVQATAQATPATPTSQSCGALGGFCCARNDADVQACSSQGYSTNLGASSDGCLQCLTGVGIQTSPSVSPSTSPTSSTTQNSALACGAIGGTECVAPGGACSGSNVVKSGSSDCSTGGLLCCGPQRHLKCTNNACVYALGAGTNECDVEGAFCGQQASLGTPSLSPGDTTSIRNLLSRDWGVSIEGNYTLGILQALEGALNRLGQKGNLYRVIDQAAGGGGYLANMSGDGTMYASVVTLNSFPTYWNEVFLHELLHAIDFGSGQSLGRGALALCSKIGGSQDTALFGTSSLADNAVSDCRNQDIFHVFTTFGEAAVTADIEKMRSYSAGKAGPTEQFNFMASFRGFAPLAQRINNRFFALISQIRFFNSLVFKRTLSSDATSDLQALLRKDQTEGAALFNDQSPGAVITSPSDGIVQTVALLGVSGEAYTNIGSNQSITKVELSLNGTVVATLVPVAAQCGTTACYTWSTLLTLHLGSNTIQARAVDAQDVRTTMPSTIIATRLSDLPLQIASIGTANATPTGLLGRVTQVKTGPGEATAAALLISAILSLLYVGYTKTNRFRRKEIEEIAKENHDSPDMDFRS